MEQLRIDPSIAYDVVELPSKGIHYANKKKSLRVAYLTASDENILAAPSLVTTNSVVTELLKRKILDKSLSIDEIVDEDRQAILIFLRNTAFGSEYTITVTDPKTNEPFTVDIDLSEKNVIRFVDFHYQIDNREVVFVLKEQLQFYQLTSQLKSHHSL